MSGDPIVVAFESATLPKEGFGHREHLYVAYSYLREMPLEEALLRYTQNLRIFTRALGVPEKYHATVTWTYMVLLAEAMRAHPGLSFDALARERPDLFDHARGALHSVYDPAVLASTAAREAFVLPRRTQA